MIDIHSHIIPYIDDGAKDLEVSLEMLRIAEREGTKTIFATPHFYKGYFETEYSEVVEKTKELNQMARDNGINIEILPGQEVFLTKDTPRDYMEGKIGTLNDSRYMLIELPMDRFPEYALDSIYELGIKGIVPIIAHPERYMYTLKKPSVLNDFIKEGCLFQINSGSLTGLFGKDIKNTAELLVKSGIVSFIGSDAHTTSKRCPGLLKSFDILSKINNEKARDIGNNGEIIRKNWEISRNMNIITVKKSIFSTIFKK